MYVLRKGKRKIYVKNTSKTEFIQLLNSEIAKNQKENEKAKIPLSTFRVTWLLSFCFDFSILYFRK